MAPYGVTGEGLHRRRQAIRSRPRSPESDCSGGTGRLMGPSAGSGQICQGTGCSRGPVSLKASKNTRNTTRLSGPGADSCRGCYQFRSTCPSEPEQLLLGEAGRRHGIEKNLPARSSSPADASSSASPGAIPSPHPYIYKPLRRGYSRTIPACAVSTGFIEPERLRWMSRPHCPDGDVCPSLLCVQRRLPCMGCWLNKLPIDHGHSRERYFNPSVRILPQLCATIHYRVYPGRKTARLRCERVFQGLQTEPGQNAIFPDIEEGQHH